MLKLFTIVAMVLITFGLVAQGQATAAVAGDQFQTDAGEKAEGCKCTCAKCKVECDHKKEGCTCPKCKAKCECPKGKDCDCPKKKGCDCPDKDCPHHKH